jgi:hypothetical protein
MASEVSVEVSEFSESGDGWVEACASIIRDDEPDEELRNQILLMKPNEMEALYQNLKVYYEQGMWTIKRLA